jgi:hypothetical protein
MCKISSYFIQICSLIEILTRSFVSMFITESLKYVLKFIKNKIITLIIFVILFLFFNIKYD